MENANFVVNNDDFNFDQEFSDESLDILNEGKGGKKLIYSVLAVVLVICCIGGMILTNYLITHRPATTPNTSNNNNSNQNNNNNDQDTDLAMCIYRGIKYEDTEQFKALDTCNMCTCNDGKVTCSVGQTCVAPTDIVIILPSQVAPTATQSPSAFDQTTSLQIPVSNGTKTMSISHNSEIFTDAISQAIADFGYYNISAVVESYELQLEYAYPNSQNNITVSANNVQTITLDSGLVVYRVKSPSVPSDIALPADYDYYFYGTKLSSSQCNAQDLGVICFNSAFPLNNRLRVSIAVLKNEPFLSQTLQKIDKVVQTIKIE